MRTETVYIMAHPDKERFFSLPRRPTKQHATSLQKQGYTIFTTTVTFPPEYDTATTTIEATSLKEDWSKDDDEKSTDSDEA